MIRSMTGFGRDERRHNDSQIIVEVRSLNSKQSDVRIKSAAHLGHRELDLRKQVLNSAVRGKIDVLLEIKAEGVVTGVPDAGSVKAAYLSLKSTADALGVDDSTLFSTVVRLPGIANTEEDRLDDALWTTVHDAVDVALDKLSEFRDNEGKSLYDDLKSRVEKIDSLLKEVDDHEVDRSEALKQRLQNRMQEIEQESIDQNRFEQEILYYMDKLDVHEEKIRLAQHCVHFLEILEAPTAVKGKKLTFVSQEIGREVNTLGAKAQWSPIQRIVVHMKDELEKIKEQLANVL